MTRLLNATPAHVPEDITEPTPRRHLKDNGPIRACSLAVWTCYVMAVDEAANASAVQDPLAGRFKALA